MPTPSRMIRLIGVRQNNLKNIDVSFPIRKISVVTGLSGSGKSSLAFDTLYAEGQRRYIESLSTYTRQFLAKMPKPDLDSIENIPPAIALEQKNHVINSRSTVGTQTEIVDYLKILFAKVGTVSCVDCGGEVKKLDSQTILNWSLRWLPSRKALIVAPIGKPLSAAKPAKTKKSAGTLFQILEEQGYQRILWKKPDTRPEVVKVGEITPSDLSGKDQIHVVVDRLKIGKVPDPDARARLLDSIDQALAIGNGRIGFFDLDTDEWKNFETRFACMNCGREHRVPEPNLFSFNSPLGACSHCSGFGFTLELDESLVVPDPSKTLKNGAIDPLSKPSFSDWQADFFRFLDRHGISIGKRYRELTPDEKSLIWKGDPKDVTFPGILGCFEELKKWKYKLHIRVFIRRYQTQNLCPTCRGSRLKPEAMAVKIRGKSIAEVLESPVEYSLDWVRKISLSTNEKKISGEAIQQVERRLAFLEEVGVGYLTLSRLAKTLSGGEFQRINLATHLGNGLCGTLYVLDEPSIGLHAADTQRLIRILERLRDQGNTIVVVEHDLDVIRAANWLVELGPGAGRRGGAVVAHGIPEEFRNKHNSLTAKYLCGVAGVFNGRPHRPVPKRFLRLVGCQENNLKNIDVDFPLDRFVVVTGVSGSGKSTLVHKTLFQALSKIFYRTPEPPGRFDRFHGAEQIAGVVLLDQTPIGKTSRSNPATYLKAWDEIRRIYANQVLSLRRGYAPQHFSFNVDGGRCPVCKGEGEITLDMHFMADLKLPCEECDGRRFKKSVLEVFYRGKNVHQLLQTTVDDAYEIFRDNTILVRKLGILRDVGLGYLQLGQSGATLSGGESQRLKIAACIEDKTAENLLYIFDEPTTGLHLEDIKKLLGVIQDLVQARNSVIMIEHHLDVIAQADWVIDLGPGGGKSGGDLIAAGTPAKLSREPRSTTGEMLLRQGYQLDPSS